MAARLLAEHGTAQAAADAVWALARENAWYREGEGVERFLLAKPGSRPYCSAQPTGVLVADFPGCDYLLPPAVWSYFDWSVSHCVLRGDNEPILLS